MRKKIIGILVCMLLITTIMPLSIAENNESNIKNVNENIIFKNEEKNLVHIIGKCHDYGFGGYLHIGRLWWCPNPDYSINLGFQPENLYILRINGEKIVPSDVCYQINVDMVKFFGLAPTLINFVLIPPDIIHVFGFCEEVTVYERIPW